MLSRLEQVALIQEVREDVATSDASLYVIGNASFSVVAPQATFDLQTFERQIKRDTLTPLRGLTGMKMGMIKFSLEMAGNTTTDATVFPEFDLPLRACGFRREKLLRIPGAFTTGTLLRHGDVVTQTGGGAGGATATVVSDTYTGQGELWVTQGESVANGSPTNSTFFLGSGTITVGTGATIWTGTTASQTPAPVFTQTGALAMTTSNDGIGYWPITQAITNLATNASGIAVDIPDGTVLVTTVAGTKNYFIKYGTQAAVGTEHTLVAVRRIIGHTAISTAVKSTDDVTTYFTTSGVAAAREVQYLAPTLTMGGLFDGVRESIAGARGTVKVRCAIGEPAMLDFEFKGKKNTFQDGGLLSGVSYSQALPPVILDADFSVADDTMTFAAEAVPPVSIVEFDMANTVQYRKSIDAATGLLESYIAERKPTFSVDPEALPEAFFDWLAMYSGNLNTRMRMRVGTTNGNKFLITALGLAITASGVGDRDGIRTRQITGNLTSGSQSTSTVLKDNELVIIWQLA